MPIESAEAVAALDRLRHITATLPEVSERLSHGTPTFFVRARKTLVQLWDGHHDDDRLHLWAPAPPGVQAEMVAREPERFFVPPYVGHRGWLGIDLEVDVDWEEIEAIIIEAYRLVAPKTLVRRLDEVESSEPG